MNTRATSPSFPEGLPPLRSEFEARGLTALKAAAIAAKAAYHAHQYEGAADDMEAQIAFDIEEKRLMRASSDASRAYDAALAAFVAKNSVDA